MSGHGFKAQLKEALSSAVGYFQDGGDPNAACVKAANEAGFNADQADRLVETFNTARVICHYKAAEDKTSSCSLADKETVRSQLTTVAETKAAEYRKFDYGCYKQAEVDHVVPAVKEAAFELKEEPLSKEASDWLKVRERTTIRELAREASEQARGLHSMADELATKAAERLCRNVTLSDVHDKMARLVHAYALDDRYAPGVEKVAAFIPAVSDPDIGLLAKYAKAHVVDTSDLADILPAVKEAADFVAEAVALEVYAEEMDKIAQEKADDSDLEGKSGPELKDLLVRKQIKSERARNAGLGAVSAKVPAASGSSGSPKPGLGTQVKDFSGSKLVAYLTDSLKAQSNAAREARIGKATDGVNNVRRQLILQDLLTRDKVLSQEDPSRVVAAFRSVHQISPDSTLNKEILRSMLRSVVQSVAISPYDAKTLADVDKARRQAYDPKASTKGDDK